MTLSPVLGPHPKSSKAHPATDVWAKPRNTFSFNAPILYQTVPLQSFRRARVAFNAQWTQQYDQGGLIIVLNNVDGSQKWVKTGIEMTHGKPHLSTVSKDRWADWRLLPAPSGGQAATIELVREPDDSLWVYLVEGCAEGAYSRGDLDLFGRECAGDLGWCLCGAAIEGRWGVGSELWTPGH